MPKTTLGKVITIGPAAVGKIGPKPRIKRREIDAAKVSDLARRVAGSQYYVRTGEKFGANAGGGTTSLIVADALSGLNRFRNKNQNLGLHAHEFLSWMLQYHNNPEGRRIFPRVCIDGRLPDEGYHNDSVIGMHENCGFQIGMVSVFSQVAEHGGAIRTNLRRRGFMVTNSTHQTIAENAASILRSDYITDDPQQTLKDVYSEVGGESVIAPYHGDHTEILAADNWEVETTLDRFAIVDDDEFGPDYGAFNLDVGSLAPSMATIYIPKREADLAFAAAMYANVAAEFVLSDKSLLLVSRQ
jgi:hypothetical protein